MPRKDIEALQLERLKSTVAYCYNNVPFYNKKLTEAGVFDGSKIKQLSDIQYIPFTTKDDFRDNYPFGMSAVPMKDIVRIHASSGTTGKPTVGVYTKEDIDIWSELSDLTKGRLRFSGMSKDAAIKLQLRPGEDMLGIIHKIFEKYLKVTVTISNDRMYQVVGCKTTL